MIKKTEFETLEELQRVYPIGSIFSTSIEKERWYYHSEKDIKAAISMWGKENVTVLDEDIIVVTKKFNTYVQGYIFDGNYWRPAGNGYNCTYGGNNGTKHDYNEILQYWLTEGERNFTKTAKYFHTEKGYISDIIKSMGYGARTWEEVNNSDHDSIKRRVNKIDPNTGKVLKTYNSITEAAIDMGNKDYAKTISPTCKGKHPTYLGYCWQYVEDIGKPIYLNKQQKIIIVPYYNLEFKTLNECAE